MFNYKEAYQIALDAAAYLKQYQTDFFPDSMESQIVGSMLHEETSSSKYEFLVESDPVDGEIPELFSKYLISNDIDDGLIFLKKLRENTVNFYRNRMNNLIEDATTNIG